jgi:hypothetical protein
MSELRTDGRRENVMSRCLKVLSIEDDEDDFFFIKELSLEIGSFEFVLDWAETYDSGIEAIHGAERRDYAGQLGRVGHSSLGQTLGMKQICEPVRKLLGTKSVNQ